MIIPSPHERSAGVVSITVVSVAIVVAAAIVGIAAAVHYARLDLTLSHYDTRGHLIVARRIMDSLTPGWQQIGAVWLPLPHLLNGVPVQVDSLYRSGLSAVVISILSFAAATGAIAWIVATLTGSLWAAVAAAVVFAWNPNTLYLQSTPMTEPLLLGLMVAGVALLISWCRGAHAPADRLPGIVLAMACLTRYEAWPVTAAALGLALWIRFRSGADGFATAVRNVARVAVWPVGAVLGFVVFSRVVIGQWFASGFFVPDNPARGRPLAAAGQVLYGVATLGGTALTIVAAAGLALCVVRHARGKRNDGTPLVLSLAAAGALPWLAFLQGHPFRIRYMVPLLAAQAVGVGIVAGSWKQVAPAVVGVVAIVLATGPRPFDRGAPMVLEAQVDQPNADGREVVTACLAANYDDTTVMASMGSLGHYMQELSHSGFALRDFLHEGNGDIWLSALNGARPFVGWVMVEERAEGGDMLAERMRRHPQLMDGFSRVCEGGGVALYRRLDRVETRRRAATKTRKHEGHFGHTS